jgi:hypothetical protein
MSGLVLALCSFILCFLAHLVFSHLVSSRGKEPVLVRFMVASIILYGLAYPVVPVDRLPAPRVLPALVDLVTGLAALGFLVLGYVEFWSLVERSFSLRILIDTATSPDGRSRSDLAKSYSEGRGLAWMMDKRVEDLVGARMLAASEGGFRLTTGGRLVARVFSALQRLLRIDA